METKTLSEKLMSFSFGLFALMSSLMLLVAGCTQADTAPEAPAAPAPQPTPVPDDSDDTIVVPEDVEVARENTNTAVDDADETTEQLIADGQYKDIVSYESPAGEEDIEVSLTVKNDVITAVSFEVLGKHPVSIEKQQGMADVIPALVIGKKIDALNIPAQVGGSSLTTAAFKTHVDDLIEKF